MGSFDCHNNHHATAVPNLADKDENSCLLLFAISANIFGKIIHDLPTSHIQDRFHRDKNRSLSSFENFRNRVLDIA